MRLSAQTLSEKCPKMQVKSSTPIQFYLCISQNVFDAADGDDNPVGAIVKLVADLIDGFVEKIGFEKNLEIVRILREKRSARGRLQIFLEKRATHVAIPDVGPAFEERDVLGAHARLPKRAVS